MGFARRIISTWVATVVFLGVLTCGSQAVAAQPMLGSADTMEKVFRDEAWNRPPVTRLAIEAARNEVQGIQLVVVAGKETVRSANLEISDLTGEAGGSIPKANVAWNVVGYVETERPIYQVRKVGWWPDPLLPPGKFDVHSGQVQPLWINVHVPADARPGLYRGAVTLRLADGQAQSVPLEVRVWNFTVPKQQHLETYEYFWLLRDALARLKKADAARHQALIAEAEKALAVDDAMVKDLTHFIQDPQVLRQARARIAGLIERATLASPTAQEATEPVPGSAAALPRWDMDTLAKSPKVYPADAPTAKDVTSVFYEGLPCARSLPACSLIPWTRCRSRTALRRGRTRSASACACPTGTVVRARIQPRFWRSPTVNSSMGSRWPRSLGRGATANRSGSRSRRPRRSNGPN